MSTTTKWVILFGSFVAYLFDALEIVVLSLALPSTDFIKAIHSVNHHCVRYTDFNKCLCNFFNIFFAEH